MRPIKIEAILFLFSNKYTGESADLFIVSNKNGNKILAIRGGGNSMLTLPAPLVAVRSGSRVRNYPLTVGLGVVAK